MTKKIIPFEINLKSSQRAGFTFQPRPQILTNDANSAELNFIITDASSTELAGSTATVLLFMKDGSFFQNTDVTRVNNTFVYTIKPNQAKHSGVAQAQLVVKIGTVENASQLVEFEIVGGLETKPIVEREIQDWTSLTAEAKAFVDQIEDFTLAEFVENKMGEELANLEVNYATRLTGLETADQNLTAQLAQNTSDLNARGLSPLGFGVVTDGTTDTTETLQTYIDYCQDNRLTMALDGTFKTSGVTFGFEPKIKGNARFIPVNNNQPFIVKLTDTTVWDGQLVVDGQEKAFDGIIASDFIVSRFGRVEVRNCLRWGFDFLRSGNNNMVKVEYFRGQYNGTRHASPFEVINVTEGTHTVVKIKLSTPIPNAIHSEAGSILYVIYDGRPYRVTNVINADEIEINNLPLTTGGTGNIIVLVGGAINIRQYGDNGVGNWGTVDLFANNGIGINLSSLYGHTFNRFVSHANGIGLASTSPTFGNDFGSPYFEDDLVPIVAWEYIDGAMHDPIIQFEKVFSLNRHNLNGLDFMPELNVTTRNKKSNMSNKIPLQNPIDQTLTPSNFYAYNFTLPITRTYTIENEVAYNKFGSAYLILHIQGNGGSQVTFNLKNTNGDTIEGGTNYTTAISGDTRLVIFRNSLGDWKVIKTNRSFRVPYFTALTGYYEKGDYVDNTDFAIRGAAGSRYVLKGWLRLTTGSAHVLNVDWLEDRIFTGS